jgi:hypothetical protein
MVIEIRGALSRKQRQYFAIVVNLEALATGFVASNEGVNFERV